MYPKTNAPTWQKTCSNWHHNCGDIQLLIFPVMKQYIYYRIAGIIFLIGLVFSSACDKQVTGAPGILEGTISIGPICPVETIPPDPGCLPTAETFKAYPVSVWTANGKIKIAQIYPALDGSFITELAAGNYLVVLDKSQAGVGSSNLPAIVSIKSLDKTIINIDIDTGIR
jgi:hypothetical protein